MVLSDVVVISSDTASGLSITQYVDTPRGGYSQKNWAGVWGPLLRTLTLFMTKICDILHPVYDLTKNSKPNL